MKKDNIVISKKRFIIIVAVCIIIFASIITTCILLLNNSNSKIDNSNLTDEEVIEYLESLGYNYDKTMYSNLLSTTYVTITDKNDDIRIQKIINDLVGTLYTFQNSSYNDSHADILNIEDNDDEEETIQYSAYKKWLIEVNLSDNQIISSINFFDQNTDTKLIDMDQYLDIPSIETQPIDNFKPYNILGIEYQVPSDWGFSSTADGNYHYPNKNSTNELLYVYSQEMNNCVGQGCILDSDTIYDNFFNGLKGSSDEFNLLSEKKIKITNKNSRKLVYTSKINSYIFNFETYLLYIEEKDTLYVFSIGVNDNVSDEVNSNINAIINSIKLQ